MNLYAESSAILGWLFGEPRAEVVRRALARADMVLASDLTLVECDRILIRRQMAGALSETEALKLRGDLAVTSGHWNVMRIEGAIIERARRPFPTEPVRTLDAVHLASALAASALVEDVGLLSLDKRVRTVGRALGLTLVPP